MRALEEPIAYALDLTQGRLNAAPGRYEKRLRDLDGLYADTAAFAAEVAVGGDAVVYEVTDVRPPVVEGGMIFGVTHMAPGRIGREFYMTRGHIHARADRPEIYVGEAGAGVMLLESPAGEMRVVPITPGVVCYVPPFWIHRSVNTGPGPFIMLFSYPADAGQDYEIIARAGGMRWRVVDDGAGGWTTVENPHWRPRDPTEIARLMGEGA